MKLRKIQRKNKKAMSAIIGYVLLITFGIILSVIVFTYLKTYVPKDKLDCPSGISIFLKEYSCVGNNFNVTIKNNGKFNILGFSMYGANNTEQEIATIDFSQYLNPTSPGKAFQGTFLYDLTQKEMKPQDEQTYEFTLDEQVTVAFIELIPTREQDNNFVACGNARIKESITCT